MWPARLGELVICFILFSMFLLCFFGMFLFLDTFLTRRIQSYDVTRSPRIANINRKQTIVVNLTDVSLRSAESGSRHQSACSNHTSSTLTNPVLPVSNLVFEFQHDAERHPTVILFSTFSPLGRTPKQNCTNTLSSLVVHARTPDCCCSRLGYPALCSMGMFLGPALVLCLVLMLLYRVYFSPQVSRPQNLHSQQVRT